MTGGKRGSGRSDEPRREGGDREGADLASAELLAGLRLAAREQEAEAALVPAELVAPPSDGERDAILRAIAGARTRRVAAAEVAPTPAPPALSKRRWSIKGAVVGASFAVAAAAAVALYVRPAQVALPPLPTYSMTISGGLKALRGASDAGAERGMPVVRADAQTEIVLICRPEVAIEGAIDARTFLVRDQTVREISSPLRVSPAGSLEIRFNPVKDAGAGRGQWALRVAVGRPDRIRALSFTAARTAAADPAVTWLKGALEVVAD